MLDFFKAQPGLNSPHQKTVFTAVLRQINFTEDFLKSLARRLYKPVSRQDRYRTRLFGALFALHAYLAAFPEDRASGQNIYLRILGRAGQGLFLPKSWKESEARFFLEESCRALFSEMNNVGAGQFALAALWMRSFEQAQSESDTAAKVDWAAETGRLIGYCLAVWAGLYTDLTGKPMQTYQAGFKRSSKDSEGLRALF